MAVCGTRFGQLWIDTLWVSRSFRVVAVVARGSQHSKAVCKRYGVPLVKRVSSVRVQVDAAVVAVGGPAGENLAMDWLKRGIPVLLEHPVRHGFLKQIHAKKNANACLLVNGHFSDLPEVRKFIRICVEGIRNLKTFTVAFTATERTLYSSVDIIVEFLTDEQISKALQSKNWRRKHSNSLQLGPMKLIPSLVPDTGEEDTPAASIGGHLIQCWLPQSRVVLVGPTGPVITLNADNVATTMWDFHQPNRFADWRPFYSTTRPAALLKALRRLLGRGSQLRMAARTHRDLLVALLCRRIFDVHHRASR